MAPSVAAHQERDAAMKVKFQTIRAMLDRDEGFGFALARLRIGPGDTAWFPGEINPVPGPCTITYERRNGRVRASIT